MSIVEVTEMTMLFSLQTFFNTWTASEGINAILSSSEFKVLATFFSAAIFEMQYLVTNV